LAGQERLSRGRVLVVGAGGLGSPVLAYLAAAGVGRILVIDDDTVDVTNLQRQILYDTGDVGEVQGAARRRTAARAQPADRSRRAAVRFDASNARELVRLVDVVVDGSDTFATRYLVNDACVLEGKPDVYGSIFRFDGQVSVFGAPGGPCYRCLYPEAPPEHLVPSAARAACWACWPEWSARGKPTKRSSCCSGSARR
jgi:molybdopterin/thiamine biosynthesis adenylyltransferase